MRALGVRLAPQTLVSGGGAGHFWIVLGVQEGLAVCAISQRGLLSVLCSGIVWALPWPLGSQQGCIMPENTCGNLEFAGPESGDSSHSVGPGEQHVAWYCLMKPQAKTLK